MHKSLLSSAVLTATLLISGIASAEWKGEAELGYVKTGGNTDTSSLNAKGEAEQESEKWRNTVKAGALKNATNGVTTAERYFVNGQTNYKFTERSYFFAFLGYEEDPFSGYDYRYGANIGYGNRVIENDSVTLALEIAPGTRQSKVTLSGDNESEMTIAGVAEFLWNISDTTKFNQDLTVNIGDKSVGGTVTRSLTSLTSHIAGNLSTKVSYALRHASIVPSGKEKLDDTISIALLYKFGK